MSNELTQYLREELKGIKAEIAEVSEKLSAYHNSTSASLAVLHEKSSVTERNITELWQQKNDLESRVDKLQLQLEGIESQAKGASKMWGFIIGGIGIAATIIGAVVAIKGN